MREARGSSGAVLGTTLPPSPRLLLAASNMPAKKNPLSKSSGFAQFDGPELK
jgi:hypothetical protein